MKIDLSKKPKPEVEGSKKESNNILHNTITTMLLIAITVGMTFIMVKFTGINAMDRVEVDAYDAIKDEHITLLEMNPEEFRDAIESGDAGIAISLPDEKKNKSKEDLQDEIKMLKDELQEVIDDATETEKELKAQLKESTSDVAEDRQELKAELEDVIRTSEETERQLREENTKLTNHINGQKDTIAGNEQTIGNMQQTIDQLREEIRELEARETEPEGISEEMRGGNENEESNR